MLIFYILLYFPDIVNLKNQQKKTVPDHQKTVFFTIYFSSISPQSPHENYG